VTDHGISYRDAGVDLQAARTHTANMAGFVRGGVAGFAGGLALPPMRDGILLACTDGVGTKLLLARESGIIDGLGQDLVAMCVNDLICSGARPLGFLDYLAVGRLDPEEARVIVGSIAQACEDVDCALLGGETAELPGLYQPGHFDLAGFAMGIVERDQMLGPERVRDGDLVIGIPSSGLHSNGFSLVRALLAEGALDCPAEVLLAPTRLYVRDVLGLLEAAVPVHAVAHITGGGLPENLPRALPAGLEAVVDPTSWQLPPALTAILECGRVATDDAWETFNMGIGLCLIAPAGAQADIVARIPDACVIGAVAQGTAGVRRV
jgi:phosphoribosylformylglycinamidine cyclo-ligase